MNIDRTLDDSFCLNIMCYPLGSTQEEFFDKITTTLNQSLTKLNLSPPSQSELKDKGKTAVPFRDWSRGFIKCRYYTKSPQVDWAECQIYYKCHASIIILDAAEYDVKKLSEDMARVKKSMFNDQITTYRLIVFNCKESQAEAFKEDKFNALFAPQAEEKIPVGNLGREVEKLICNTALHFFGEMTRLKQDNHTIALFNSKEEIIDDPSKIKKRKQGRSLKVRGDLALILGGFRDAFGYYNQAFDILKPSEDNLWIGKLFEAQASCLYLEYLFADQKDQDSWDLIFRVVGALNEKMRRAIEHFQRARTMKGWDFNTDCYLKWFRVLKNFDARKSFNESVSSYMEVPEHRLLWEKHC